MLVHIHDWLVMSKAQTRPLKSFEQSLSSRQLSLRVWQKKPWPQSKSQK
jgi:hypothetical protein